MFWWARAIFGVYSIGFILTFWLNVMVGPLTLGLCLLRAVVWPIWVTIGWPHGVPLTMD